MSILAPHTINFRAPPPALDNNYDRVLDLWEESKITGRMDTDSYTIVIAMCERGWVAQRLGSSEAALALREDMKSQWWTGEEVLLCK